MENYVLQREISNDASGQFTLYLEKPTSHHVVIRKQSLAAMPREDWDSVLEEELSFCSLDHPNILKYHTAFIKDDSLYTVMDFAQGGNLEQKIKKSQGMLFDEDQILDWFTKISLALKYMHDRGFLHHSIQAKNIVFLRNGMLKVAGIVNTKILVGTTNFTQTAQTMPYFFAPEICQGKQYTDKTEIWALGCLLYQLCAQRPPFEGKSIPALIRKILKGNIAPIPYIFSSNLRNLVTACLQKFPSRRPNINKILNYDFIMSELHNILDASIKIVETKKSAKPAKHKKCSRPSKLMTKAKMNEELKKDFQHLELQSPKKAKPPANSDLSITGRFNIKVHDEEEEAEAKPKTPDDDIKEKVRRKRDDLLEQVFRQKHPELFSEEGEEVQPPPKMNLSDIIHISDDSSDNDDDADEFKVLADIAQSIFDKPPDATSEKTITMSNKNGLGSHYFTGTSILSDVDESVSLFERIEMLRVRLEKAIGLDPFVEAYNYVKNSGDKTNQKEIESHLRQILKTDEQFAYYPAILHLCLLEEAQ